MHCAENLIIENGVLKECRERTRAVNVPEGVHTIGEGAFKGCISIESIYLPDTVTSICRDAFKGCRKLKEITLPSNLTFLGDYAFHRCHKLENIHIPPSVESLGNCAFLYCDSLEKVSMAGVKKLGLQVFLNDVKLRTLVISTELDGDEICDCFTGCTNLREIVFSDGTSYRMKNAVAAMAAKSGAPPLVRAIAADVCRMMEIQDGAILRFLTNLKHVDLAEGITAIGKSCFFDKRGIISVALPESLQEIGSRAFRNCINLESVEFHGDQVFIHKDAFKNCSTLHRVVTADGREYELNGIQCTDDDTVPALVREIHGQVLGNFAISGTTLLKYRGGEARVVVPDGITEIGERAFAGNEAIDRVILPDSVRAIREEAFADCLVLQTITIPAKLEILERAAFIGCVKLIRASLPDTLTKIGESVFNRCRVLNEVRLGQAIEEIGPMAFYGCLKLREIGLPESLKNLGDMAFYQCLSLKEVALPCSILHLGNNVFTFSGVERATIGCTPDQYGTDVFSQCRRLRSLTFEEGVRFVGNKFAFRCEKLVSVRLPSTLVNVGRHAFEGSRYLRELPEPKIVGNILLDGSSMSGHVVLPEHVSAVAGGAFYGNSSVTGVTLPDTVTHIGPAAFCGCSCLSEIRIPAKVTEIGEKVFAYCRVLKTIKMAGGSGQIRAVGDGAFLDCTGLETIPGLERCTHIGKSAFDGCQRLGGLDVGKEVDQGITVGDQCLRGTEFLRQLAEKRSPVMLSGTVIHGETWEGRLVIPEGTVRIGEYAFYGNTSITSVTFPESLKEVGAFAFSGCSSLTSIIFSGSIHHLGKAAFEACAGLKEISLKTQDIGERAFAWCKSLVNVHCPETRRVGREAFCGCGQMVRWDGPLVKEIGDGAFSGCGNLTSFPLSNVEQIGRRAFERCDSLSGISLSEKVVIQSHAFEDCGCLRDVELCGANWESRGLSMESYAFSGCTAIRTVACGTKSWEIKGYSALFDRRLPKLVTQIYGSVLSCFAIDEEAAILNYFNNGSFLVIPEGINRIGDQVFQDKSRLKTVQIPDSVKWIGARAFDKTPWLEAMRIENGAVPVIVNHTLIDGSSSRGEIQITGEVERIAGWAFAGNLELLGVHFLSSKTAVEDHAFRNCVHLKKITLPDGKEYFLDGLGIEKKELPPMVKRIVEDCYNCFKTDESGILTECTGNISRLTLPAGIRAVGDGAFKDGNLLTVIALAPETLTIGAHAFEQCKWLEEVCGTANVERIGAMAFSGCIRLRKMGEELSHLTMLGERAFENCTCLEEIFLPEGLEEIPKRAFFRCHRLKRITLPSTLKKIGEEAFAFCYELPKLSLPEGNLEIGDRAFAWCYENGGVV